VLREVCSVQKEGKEGTECRFGDSFVPFTPRPDLGLIAGQKSGVHPQASTFRIA
jgi:hypothetical protein